MKCVLIRTPKGLIGSTPDDQEAYQRFKRRLEVMKPGRFLRLEFSSPRNGAHHRKFYALLHLITENSEPYDTIPKALVAVKLCVGHFDLMVDPTTGEITRVPRSISYEAMPQEEFDAFYSQAIDAVLQHILPTMNRATADRLMDMIVSDWG